MQRTMKKIYTLAALAMVAIVACNKEIETSIEILPADKGEVSIVAKAPAETKTTIDGLQVKWATGDHIAVIDEDNGAHDFTLDDGAGTTTGEFSGSLAGKESGGIAIYPYSGNAAYNGTNITVDYPATYAYNAVTVPMWGEEGTGENVGKYTFNHIGGAFKIQYTNVPDNAASFVFTATSSITGTASYDFSTATLTSNTGSVVTVTDLPDNDELTFFIPVPAGSYSFDVKLLDSGDNVIAGSEKTVTSAKDVAVGHVVPLRAILVPVANGTTLWSESFGDFGGSGNVFAELSDSDVSDYADAGYAGRSGYGDNSSVTLAATGSVKVSTGSATGMESGHLWFVKNEDSSVTTSAINLYGATGFTLTYVQATGDSESIAEYSDDSGSSWKSLGTQSGPGSASFSKSGLSVASIMIRVRHESSNAKNTRVDNLSVVAGTPVPGISVATNAATSVSTSGATLNGTITLLNGGVQSSITEAGFVYKVKGAGAYGDPVSVADPTASLTFSKAITGLTEGTTYTFKAFAKYDGGAAVYGDEVDVKAEVQATVATATFGNGSGDVPLNSASKNFTDSQGNAWTCTTVGTTSYTQNADYSQIGSSSKPATSITLTHTLTSAKTILSFVFNAGGFSSTAGSISIRVGETEIASGSLSGTSSVQVKTAANFEGISAAKDDVITIAITGIAKGVKVCDMTWTY